MEIKPLQNKLENKQPSNLEAEQALLGSILVNNDIIDEVSTIVNSSIFYDPAHVKIYEVIENLNNKGMIANPITLKNFFEKDNMLSDVGGTEYLIKLTRFSGSAKQAVDYAKIIHEMYLRRELVQISDKLSNETLKEHREKFGAKYTILMTPRYAPKVKRHISNDVITILKPAYFAEYLSNYYLSSIDETSFKELNDLIENNMGEDISEKLIKLTLDNFGNIAS